MFADIQDEIDELGADPLIKKKDVLMSPQDVIIECKGEQIRTHSSILYRCKYFATLLDKVDLGSDGPDSVKTIPLPARLDHDANEVREFVMVLYNCLDPADCALLTHQISKENVIMLAELAHYFDSPVQHNACDNALTTNHVVWFPECFSWLMEWAIKNHLSLLRAPCKTAPTANIQSTGLLTCFSQGCGALCKEAVIISCQGCGALCKDIINESLDSLSHGRTPTRLAMLCTIIYICS
jgi:hypothetical protein